MTERFTLIECNGNIEDGCTQKVFDGGEDVFELLDLLNSLNDENEQLKKENNELKQKNRGWRRYCESQIIHIEFIEKVLENMGYSVVFDNEKQKWVIE